MDIIKIIEIILSSSLFVAIVKNISKDKDLIANNIAKTRIESKNTKILRDCLETLYDNNKSLYKKVECFPKIKRCLNPYYRKSLIEDPKVTSEDIEHDVLIWHVIDKIESLLDAEDKDNQLENYMNALPYLIAANLKFDWDRFQSETSSKYKINYSYDYYKAVKNICKANNILSDVEFVSYKPKFDFNKSCLYIMIVLPIISYIIFRLNISECIIICSCMIILFFGIIELLNSIGILRKFKEIIHEWINLFIFAFYLLIILLIVWCIINDSKILETVLIIFWK